MITARWEIDKDYCALVLDNDHMGIEVIAIVITMKTLGIISWLNRGPAPNHEISQGMIFSLDILAAIADAKIEAEQTAHSMGWEFEVVPESELGNNTP